MAEAQPLQPGDPGRLGDYVLSGRLGEGGQGTVFLGRSPSGEPVAVKLLHAVDDPKARSRFVRELAVAKQVATFCTAQVLDADVAGDRPYIVGEFVAGPTLQALVIEEGPRGKGALERLAIGTATALTAIHRAGVVHRDFKPANVLLGSDGPRVIDFGIARALDVTATVSQLIGTPSYMAPEQLTDNAAGPAADVFAWGITIVFAATGRPAFGQDSIPAVMHRIIHDEPDLAALPDSLVEMVRAALAKDARRRPTAQQLLWWLVGTEGPAAPRTPDPVFTEARSLAAASPAAGPPDAGAPDASPAAGPPVSDNANAAVLPSGAEGLIPGFEAPPPAGTWPGQSWPEPPPAAPARPPTRDNRALVIAVAVLIGLIAGVALILGPQLYGGNDAANQPSGTAGQSNGTRPPTGPAGPRTGIPATFDGTWRGTAHNQDGVAFPAEVTFGAGQSTAQVMYSGEAHCTTTLTLTSSAPERIELSLTPTSSCTAGTVTIQTTPDGRLDYAFASSSGRYTVQGTLSRT